MSSSFFLLHNILIKYMLQHIDISSVISKVISGEHVNISVTLMLTYFIIKSVVYAIDPIFKLIFNFFFPGIYEVEVRSFDMIDRMSNIDDISQEISSRVNNLNTVPFIGGTVQGLFSGMKLSFTKHISLKGDIYYLMIVSPDNKFTYYCSFWRDIPKSELVNCINKKRLEHQCKKIDRYITPEYKLIINGRNTDIDSSDGNYNNNYIGGARVNYVSKDHLFDGQDRKIYRSVKSMYDNLDKYVSTNVPLRKVFYIYGDYNTNKRSIIEMLCTEFGLDMHEHETYLNGGTNNDEWDLENIYPKSNCLTLYNYNCLRSIAKKVNKNTAASINIELYNILDYLIKKTNPTNCIIVVLHNTKNNKSSDIQVIKKNKLINQSLNVINSMEIIRANIAEIFQNRSQDLFTKRTKLDNTDTTERNYEDYKDQPEVLEDCVINYVYNFIKRLNLDENIIKLFNKKNVQQRYRSFMNEKDIYRNVIDNVVNTNDVKDIIRQIVRAKLLQDSDIFSNENDIKLWLNKIVDNFEDEFFSS